MRPPKRILLIDTDEDRRGELKFVLQTCGFRVIQTAFGQIDLIILQWPVSAGSAKRLKEANPLTPLMVLYPVKMSELPPLVPSADAVVPESSLGGRAELLERIRVMVARKRGPRKGFTRRPPESVQPQPAAIAATA